MFRILSKLILIAITLLATTVAHAQSQSPPQDNLVDQQYVYAGISTGLFDGLTTTWTSGIYGGWIGPTRTFRQIGGIAPEVSFSVQYIRNMHLERLRHIPDMIVPNALTASFVAGPRFGGQLGFRTLVGLGGGSGEFRLRCSGGADWILLAGAEDGKFSASPAPAADTPGADPLCGKNDRRFPLVAELGPDWRFRRARIVLPLVITRFGDRGTRSQFSFRIGLDFRFGEN